MKKILKKNIRFNISLYIVLILIVKKFNDNLRIYINYRILNVLIIRNRNTFLFIKNILTKFYIIK